MMRRDLVLLAFGYLGYAASMALPAIQVIGVAYGYACFIHSYYWTALLPAALFDPANSGGSIDLMLVSLVMGSWLNTWMLASGASGWIPWRKWRIAYAGVGLLGCVYFVVFGLYSLAEVYVGYWVWLFSILFVAAVLTGRERRGGGDV